MAPETQEQQLARHLHKLGVTSRLKGAPTHHFAALTPAQREMHFALDKALSNVQRHLQSELPLTEEAEATYRTAYTQLMKMYTNPLLNPYTAIMHSEDEKTSGTRLLALEYSFTAHTLVLSDPARVTAQIVGHFYPINWDELRGENDWELMREIIPAMKVARPSLRTYDDQRWLYDERSQRCAEALSYRIANVYPDHQLPAQVPLDPDEFHIMAKYQEKLEKGGNPRRWFQEIKLKLSRR